MAEKYYYEKFKLSDDFYKLILFIGIAVLIIPMLYYFGSTDSIPNIRLTV